MAKQGGALTRRRLALGASGSSPTEAPPGRTAKPRARADPAPKASGRDPLSRLVAASVGVATLGAAVGTAWRAGHGGARTAAAQSLVSGLEVDLAAGAVALAVGLWLARRQLGRTGADRVRLSEALTRLAADPIPDRIAPLQLGGELSGVAQAFNALPAGLIRRERQLVMETAAKAEQRRLSDMAILRQDISPLLATAQALSDSFDGAWDGADAARRDRRIAEALGRMGHSVLATVEDLAHGAPTAAPSSMLQSAALDLAELAEDIATLLWAQASAKGLDLAVYVDPQTPRTIQGDAVQLRQIVAGLAVSALAVTQEGGVLIEIEPDSSTSVRISIHDTGPAIAQPAEDSSPQTGQMHAETRPGDPDGALPARLAVYRKMVLAMGGAFATPSRRAGGATFALRLRTEAQDSPPADAADGAPILIAVRGACTRRALSRYVSRFGMVARVYEGAAPAADVGLVIADDASLKALGPLDIPVVRLIARAEPSGSDMASDVPAAAATLDQPIRRADLDTLLRRFRRGQPLKRPTSADPVFARGGLGGAATNAFTQDELAMLADLERAAERDQLALVYQPQVDRESERILGVEALLRWTHPTRGAVSPDVFIPLAERAGRIAEVTNWVVDRVLAETHYLSGLQVSFNASALEFAQRSFVDRLLAAIASSGYDARRLEVEITETAILHHETPVRDSMDRLHAAGIGVALDDFGAGYSSLSHLRRYPFDKLKIDRGFITDCSRDMESATVVHAVVSIGRALGMKVIAEGVETQTQFNFLRIAGVYAMQGFLFGRPMPIDNLAPLIGAGRAKTRGGDPRTAAPLN